MVHTLYTPLSFLIKNAAEQPEAIGLKERENSWSFSQLYSEVARLGARLVQAGVRRGDRIAILTNHNSECFMLLFAIWAAGGVAAPINISLPAGQKNIILQKLRPHLCVFGETQAIDEDFAYPVLPLAQADGKGKDDFNIADRQPEDQAVILFTSGTTGLPKGAVISHRALAMNCRLTAEALGILPEDRILINTPAYYTSAIVHLLTMFSKGAGLATHQGFLFSTTFLELIRQHECTGFGGAPAHFIRIFAEMDSDKDPGSLRFMMSSGDHLPVEMVKRALAVFPDLRVYCVYGLTEVAGRLCIMPPQRLREKLGSVGLPLPGMTVRTIGDDGKETPPYETGEVYVSGPMLSGQYFEDEISSRDLKTPMGFKTGDFGHKDTDGFLYLQGRKDDIFKSGGEKVSTLLIQQELSNFPDFEDVVVLPMSDEFMGAVPAVFYIPRPGITFDKRRIIRAMKHKLPATHIPTKFYEVDAIPRTGSGKLKKKELRASLPHISF